MRFLATAALLLFVFVAGACDSSLESDAVSQLLVYNNLTGALIADGDTNGAITMSLNDTRQLRVMRQVTDDEAGTVTTNVTTEADFNVENTSIVAVSEAPGTAGTITATAVGSSEIDIIYRDEDGDSTNDDNAKLTVTVIP